MPLLRPRPENASPPNTPRWPHSPIPWPLSRPSVRQRSRRLCSRRLQSWNALNLEHFPHILRSPSWGVSKQERAGQAASDGTRPAASAGDCSSLSGYGHADSVTIVLLTERDSASTFQTPSSRRKMDLENDVTDTTRKTQTSDPPQTYMGQTHEAWEGEYDFGHKSKNRIVLSPETEALLAERFKKARAKAEERREFWDFGNGLMTRNELRPETRARIEIHERADEAIRRRSQFRIV